ncbi:S1 family peptidase [Streptomyces sp. NPDC088766]|uniref:S1 family peptidase n=1 Tax=Streptomyces sp. NPDC088766 TaxID=3365893 RepID=UPI00380754EF
MGTGKTKPAWAGIAVASIVLGSGVFAPTPAGAIIGGATAGKTRDTVQVDTIKADGSLARCSGVLIDDTWVLTAKHCLGPSPSSMTVYAGSLHLNSGYKRGLKGFTGWSQADVALLELDQPVPLATPIAPQAGVYPAVGTNLAASGWGRVAGGQWPTRLNVATVRVDEYRINENHIIHLNLGRGDGIQAHGDSGGPVMDAHGILHAMTITGDEVATAVAVSLADKNLQDWLVSKT